MNSRPYGAAHLSQLTDTTLRHAMDMDCSISLAPGELQRYLDMNSTATGAAPASPTIAMLQRQHQQRRGGGSSSLLFGSADSLANHSAAAAGMGGANAMGSQRRTQLLFAHFLEVVQARTNDSEIFETVRDLIQVCTDTLGELAASDVATGLSEPSAASTNRALGAAAARDRADCDWLTKERDTWRLLYALYKDRLCVQPEAAAAAAANEDDAMEAPLLRSEKQIVERLYAQNANLREYQLVVDWLEQSAAEQAAMSGAGGFGKIGCFTDRTVGWENTLMQLKAADQSMFGGGGGGGGGNAGNRDDMVRSMDPDAPLRERRRLHDLDEEDQRRLAVQVLRELRMGRIEEAQALCEHCGQPWQAAVLEGWRLHHDGNYERGEEADQTRKLPIDGNPRRDLWKLLAWRTADSATSATSTGTATTLDPHQRAIYGILSGHLAASIAPLSHSWPDLLWAYLKVQIDLRVESEIRSCSLRTHLEMPAAYWSGAMSPAEIFAELLAHDNLAVSSAARHPMATIQRFLVLDAVPEMLAAIDGWLISGACADAQQLRFLAHLVLFLRQVGRMPASGGGERGDEIDCADRVLRAYVLRLIEAGAEPALVAFYAAAVPARLQLVLYSRYLRTLEETAARRAALEEAEAVGLDVAAIARHTVRVVRAGKRGQSAAEEAEAAIDDPAADYDAFAAQEDEAIAAALDEEAACPAQQRRTQLAGSVSTADSRRISALEWLSFYAEQKADLLREACALIRTFLAEARVECVRRAFEMVPIDTVGRLLEDHGGEAGNLPAQAEAAVKEYLGYQAYLAALDAYNEWTRCWHSQPAPPKPVADGAAFTERIAAEHREQGWRAERQRWQVALAEQTRVARELMLGVLRFPEGGWLVDPEREDAAVAGEEGDEEAGRAVQLESLRKLCVPEMVLLLHRVLHEAGEFRECVRLADELADEGRGLWRVYSRQRLAEIVGKVAESSLALMNEKMDPWGYAVGT